MFKRRGYAVRLEKRDVEPTAEAAIAFLREGVSAMGSDWADAATEALDDLELLLRQRGLLKDQPVRGL